MSKCKAKTPAACRVHGVNFLTNQLYKEYGVKDGISVTPEQCKDFVEQVVLIIDSFDTDPDTTLESKRDAEGIYNLHVATYWADPDSMEQNKAFPVQEAIEKIAFLRDNKKSEFCKINMLEPPVSGAPYKKFDHVLASYIAEKGTPMKARRSMWGGWEDYDMAKHVSSCGIAAVDEAKEDNWTRPLDTFENERGHDSFDDTDRLIHGATAKAQCKCGFFKGELRVEGSLTNMVRDLVKR